MATSTLIEKIGRDISDLKKDLAVIKTVIFDTDPEGEYKDSFVKKMIKRAKEKTPYIYCDKQSFLSHVRGKV